MQKGMETVIPLVSVVMATYDPNLGWLSKQLASLNDQTYLNMELIVIDDCSKNIQKAGLEELISKHITRMPYLIMRNEKNLGSNLTFEELTYLANGKYIAYCDQDDVWHDNKIQTFVKIMETQYLGIVCSDMNIIDERGVFKGNSLTKVRKHHRAYSGTGLENTLLFCNFVTGCAMMIRKDLAQKAIPFCPYMVHDHWLALFTAECGEGIYYMDKPMIDYRVHETNQTLAMGGVFDKTSYMRQRIHLPLKQMQWLKERFNVNAELSILIDTIIIWLKARRNYFIKGNKKYALTIWKYRHYSRYTSLFELLCPYMPEKMFMWIINLKSKNII